MIKIIQFLQENVSVLELLKEEKVSLVGVTEAETHAILEAFEEEIDVKTISPYWQ
ncbi:competence pheromone ComX [Lysinibacillus sp. NPDC058147]|uniref:competence pheromone ComX n=1 Tax=unclassified Lysinibacillus TaxID=2636778 RepID=UPI0036DB6C84